MNTVQNEKDIKRMIEVILSFEDDFSQRKERYRFEMSGYENVTGDVTIYNQMILNKFAHLGIYDYTRFLFLDFYKGVGTLYFQYWNSDEVYEIEFPGLGTVEIIEEILKLTVYSGKQKRRRN